MEVYMRDMPYEVRVEKAVPRPGMRLELWFEDGNHGVFDMSHHVYMKMYSPLTDLEVFNAVCVEDGMAVWPGGIDIAPEELWLRCEPLDGHDWRHELLPARRFERDTSMLPMYRRGIGVEGLCSLQQNDLEYQRWLNESYPEKAREDATKRLEHIGIPSDSSAK